MSSATSELPIKRTKRPLEDIFNDDDDVTTTEESTATSASPAKQLCNRPLDGEDRSNTASPIKRSSLARASRQEGKASEMAAPQSTTDTSAPTASIDDQDKPRDTFWEELQKYESLLAESATTKQQNTATNVAEEPVKEQVPSVASRTLPCLPVLTPYLDVLHPTLEMLGMERNTYEQSLGSNKSLFSRYWTTKRGIVDATSYHRLEQMAGTNNTQPTVVDEQGQRLRDFDGQMPLKWLYEEQNLPAPAGVELMTNNKNNTAFKEHRGHPGRSDYRHRGRARGGGAKRGGWSDRGGMVV
ncbi:hypothetical protein BDF22DRAFT_701567, partial [Syncephalis plumigaleata]